MNRLTITIRRLWSFAPVRGPRKRKLLCYSRGMLSGIECNTLDAKRLQTGSGKVKTDLF